MSVLLTLCDLNYVPIYFGRDIDAPRFVKNSTEEWNEEPLHKLNFLERYFYKKSFNNAVLHVAGLFVYKHLKKYSKNPVNNARAIVDKEIFNEDVKSITREKTKFVFFSPNRIEKYKGTDILWNALQYCKTDFEILQVNWFGETQNEEKLFKKNILKNIPKQVTLIPMVKYTEIARYYNFADAVIGNLFIGNHEMQLLLKEFYVKNLLYHIQIQIQKSSLMEMKLNHHFFLPVKTQRKLQK